MSIRLSELLDGKKAVALGGHIRPDGDCVGACMGLYLYLKEQYPQIMADVYLEYIPGSYRFIQDTEIVRHEIMAGQEYDLFICLDCGDQERLGFSAPLFERAAQTCCIDHHASNRSFADFNEIVPDASSTSELVYHLLDKEKISLACAEALYMGIAHDTGVFRYSCMKPETLETAAELLRKGVNGTEIVEKTFYEKTYVQNQILGMALLESIQILDKRCIVAWITKKNLAFFGASPEDMDGIVNQLKQTQGMEVALFFYETETHLFKVSLRSREKVDVSKIATYFGGGGHVRAAGFTMAGTVHDVINNVSQQIALQLDGAR